MTSDFSEFDAAIVAFSSVEIFNIMKKVKERYKLNEDLLFSILIKSFALACKENGLDYRQYKKFSKVILTDDQYENLKRE
jgi:hypothetical protein